DLPEPPGERHPAFPRRRKSALPGPGSGGRRRGELRGGGLRARLPARGPRPPLRAVLLAAAGRDRPGALDRAADRRAARRRGGGGQPAARGGGDDGDAARLLRRRRPAHEPAPATIARAPAACRTVATRPSLLGSSLNT